MENEDFKKKIEETNEIGSVIFCSDPIVYLSGLPSLRVGEKVISEDGEIGMSCELDRKKAAVLMFQTEKIEAGKRVARTGDFFKIPISQKILGRVVSPLCLPLDKMGPVLGKKDYLPVIAEAPGITKRVKINEPLETGVMMVDLLVPIGYGQREAVIGDSKTGKTAFLLQLISNQVKKGAICIYVGIGKESSALKSVENYFKEMDVFERVVMLITTADQSSTLHYLAPFSGMAVAEYFRDMGNKVVIVFDDLTTHAKAYREISLLLKRAPGREAYPGDVFHIHATLVERAGNIKTEDGKEASITAFPVAETLENNISGFIQTNLLSMTDGHIFFDIEQIRKGKFPAVNPFLSVSRAGNQTRGIVDKGLVGKIKRRMIDYRKILEVSQFGSELSKEVRQTLDFGEKIEILFGQDLKTLIPQSLQSFLFGLLFSGFWKDISKKAMEKEIKKILKNFNEKDILDLEEKIKKIKDVEDLKDFCEEISLQIEKFV